MKIRLPSVASELDLTYGFAREVERVQRILLKLQNQDSAYLAAHRTDQIYIKFVGSGIREYLCKVFS